MKFTIYKYLDLCILNNLIYFNKYDINTIIYEHSVHFIYYI